LRLDWNLTNQKEENQSQVYWNLFGLVKTQFNLNPNL